MEGSIITLILKENRIFLTDSYSIAIAETNIQSPIVSFCPNAYWSVRVIGYDKTHECLVVDMTGGGISAGNVSITNDQIQYFQRIGKVRWLDFKGALPNVVLSTCLFNNQEKPYFKNSEPLAVKYYEMERPPQLPLPKPINEPKEIHETITVKFKDVVITDKYAVITRKFNQHPEKIELNIFNDFLRNGFDPIKKYFENCLGIKEIKVKVDIVFNQNKIISKDARSTDIDRINAALIEEVRFDAISNAYKKIPKYLENNIVTKEEFFQIVLSDNGDLSNLIDDNSLLEGLLNASNTKHRLQLSYLADLNKTDIMKLRLVLRPFSFLFFIEGLTQYHFVWETLDGTDATYIWSYPIDGYEPKICYQNVKNKLDLIYKSNRSYYLKEKDENFAKVIHDYKNEKAGFDNWKKDMVRIIEK